MRMREIFRCLSESYVCLKRAVSFFSLGSYSGQPFKDQTGCFFKFISGSFKDK